MLLVARTAAVCHSEHTLAMVPRRSERSRQANTKASSSGGNWWGGLEATCRRYGVRNKEGKESGQLGWQEWDCLQGHAEGKPAIRTAERHYLEILVMTTAG
jgi:hypothetical protein